MPNLLVTYLRIYTCERGKFSRCSDHVFGIYTRLVKKIRGMALRHLNPPGGPLLLAHSRLPPRCKE